MKTVYLAGPITGLMYGDSVDWRNKAVEELAAAGIRGLSPMRGKEYLKDIDIPLGPDGDKYSILGVMSTNKGILTRDRWDCTRCDMLLVNFLGAKQVSIGTCMEIAWADLSRIPIVAVIEPGNAIHDHGMVLEAIGFRVKTMEAAMHVLKMALA